MSRRAAIVFLTAFLGFLVVVATARAAAVSLFGGMEPHPSEPPQGHRRTIGHGQIRFDGAGPERWALRFRRERELVDRLQRRLTRQRYTILHNPDVVEAIDLAAATYGHGNELWRKARCESGLDPYARNLQSAATGLFQFLPSTWASTPYGRFEITSPYANALAAGWMHQHGRGGEWSCR